MIFSDTICQYCQDTGRFTVSYIVFYQVLPIDNFTNFSGPVAQASSESEYNSPCTVGMALAHFIMLKMNLRTRIHMCFHNRHLSLYWIVNQLCVCQIIARTPNTPDTFPQGYIFYEMVKIEILTKQYGVRDICNWHKLEPIMLGRMN